MGCRQPWLALLLALFLLSHPLDAATPDPTDDDELIVVEDMEVEVRLAPPEPAEEEKSESTTRKSGSGRRRRKDPEKKKVSAAEVFNDFELHLIRMDHAFKEKASFRGYMDKDDVEELERGVQYGASNFFDHFNRVTKKQQANPSLDPTLFEQGTRLHKFYRYLLDRVQEQVELHRQLMESTLMVIPHTKKHKALRRDIESRLKGRERKSTGKVMASLSNVKEMIKIQERERSERLSGLSERELLHLAAGSLVPFVLIHVLRIAVWIAGFRRVMRGKLWDLFIAAFTPALSTVLVGTRAGWAFFSNLNIGVLVGLAVLLFTLQLFLWLEFSSRLLSSKKPRKSPPKPKQ